jgi:hypothetical protein
MWIECPKLFQDNNIIYFKQLNIGTHGSTSFAFNSDQNNCILVACDNTYTMESKDELTIVDFFIHPLLLSFAINITCNLSKVTKGILVTNVTCD